MRRFIVTSVCGSPCYPDVLFPSWSLPPMVASVVFLDVVIGVHGLRVCGCDSSVNNLPSGYCFAFPSG